MILNLFYLSYSIITSSACCSSVRSYRYEECESNIMIPASTVCIIYLITVLLMVYCSELDSPFPCHSTAALLYSCTVSQPASLVESDTGTVSVVSSAFPIVTVSVPRFRSAKTINGGVRLSNLIGIKTSSVPVIIERDCDNILHLKIGLLNVGSLTSKAVIVNDHNLDLIGLTETWLKPNDFTVLNEASLP